MTPAQIVREAAATDGVTVTLEAGRPKVSGPDEALARWLPRLREHKAEIWAELEAQARGRARLETLARELRHPLEDLLAWYAEDVADLGELPVKQVRAIVAEYLQNRDTYRPPAPSPGAFAGCCPQRPSRGSTRQGPQGGGHSQLLQVCANSCPQKRHTSAAALTVSAHLGQTLVLLLVAPLSCDSKARSRSSYVTDNVPGGLTISM